MMDPIQTPASILAAQLADVLVVVPIEAVERLSDRDKFRLLDWVELVKVCASGMFFVPLPEITAMREHMTPEQLDGKWSAYTTWRPAPKQIRQASLFGE